MKLQTTLCALLFGATAAIAGCEASEEPEATPKVTELGEQPEPVAYTLVEIKAVDIPETEQQVADQARTTAAPQAAAADQQKADRQAKTDQPSKADKASGTDVTISDTPDLDPVVRFDETETDVAADRDRTVAKGVQPVGADTRTPSAAAPMSDPTFQSATKIRGDKKIPLAQDAKQIMDATDLQEMSMRVKVCIDVTGTPTNVMIIDEAFVDAQNEKVKNAIMNWRYEPATVNGQPVPSCKRVEFAYQIEDIGKTRPILFDPQAPHGENRPESLGTHQP